MKILHLPSTFLPQSTGGKEVFVYQIISHTPAIDHKVLVHSDGVRRHYLLDGISVCVLPYAKTNNRRRSYFNMMYDDLGGFENVLQEYQPDVVHFHDQGRSASLTHLNACKERGIKTLLTFHSPGQSCLQRALIFAGKELCDGRIDLVRCTACRYQLMGLPSSVANLASHITLNIDQEGKYLKRNSTQLFMESWKEFYDKIDGIQIHAKWLKQHLLQNGVKEEKIHFIDMGGHPSIEKNEWKQPNKIETLKLAFVGRCVDIKGVHILIEAIKQLGEHAPVEVHFFGPNWDNTEYGKKMSAKVYNDKKFKVPRLIQPEQVVSTLREMDVCIVPSLWPETGPFTVFDAFAAGVPIIGTNYAGIAQRVKDGVNGLLFEWGNSRDLADKIQYVIDNRDFLERLRNNIETNKTMQEFSSDISLLYRQLVENTKAN